MKKRVIALTVILAMLLTTLLGCGILTLNEERNMNQVILEVGYDSASDTDFVARKTEWKQVDGEYKFVYVEGKKPITKRELVTVFMNVGSQYISNYGLSVKEVFELLVSQLANREIMIQEAIRYFNKETGLNRTLEGCFDEKELEEMEIEVYNAYYKQIKEYKAEIDDRVDPSPSPSPTASPSPTPTPRPTQAPAVSPSPSAPTREDPIPTEGTWYDAVKRFENRLKQNIESTMTKEKYLALQFTSAMESKLMEKYQEEIEDKALETDWGTGDVSWAKLNTRYNTLKQQQQEQYDNDKASFVSALEGYDGSSFMLYSPVEGYFYVRSILVGFSEEQNNLITAITASDWSDALKKQEKDKLLDEVLAEDLRDIATYEKDKDDETKENMTKVEFPSYLKYEGKKDFETKEGKESVFDNPEGRKTSVNDELNWLNYNPYTLNTEGRTSFMNTLKAEINALKGSTEYRDSDVYNKSRSAVENAFATLTFKYGTDPGMFNNAVNYLVGNKPNPGTTEKFVTEFADGSREALKDYKAARQAGQSEEEAQIASMRIVATQYGWHVIMVTDQVTTEMNVLDKTERDDPTSFTYKFEEAIKNELKTDTFSTKQTQTVEKYNNHDGFVVRYEKRYRDLLKIK